MYIIDLKKYFQNIDENILRDLLLLHNKYYQDIMNEDKTLEKYKAEINNKDMKISLTIKRHKNSL